jgi:hypothetical protein
MAAGIAATATKGATATAVTVVPATVAVATPTPPVVVAIVPAVVPRIPTLAANAAPPRARAELLFTKKSPKISGCIFHYDVHKNTQTRL